MDVSPRGLARWLPILSLALGAEAAVSVIFAFTVQSGGDWDMIRTFIHLPHVAVLIGFAVAVRLLTSDGEFRAAGQRLLWGGFLAIGVTALARFQDIYVWSDSARAALVLQGLGSVLLGVAAPGIWGTAIAREEDLQNPRIPFVGRAFAVASLTGFGVYLVSELIRLALTGLPGPADRPTAALATFTLILFAARACLLGSTLLFWGTPIDEIAARKQSRKVQALMLAWLVASSAALIFSAIVGEFEAGSAWFASALMLLWHAVVQVTLTLIVTILVALSLERPMLDYEPRRKRTLLTEPLPPPATDNSPLDLT